MQERKPRVVEWNSCIDVPLSRGVLVHVLVLDRCTRPAEKRGTAHADLLVGAQVLADQCKQSAGDSIWVCHTAYIIVPISYVSVQLTDVVHVRVSALKCAYCLGDCLFY